MSETFAEALRVRVGDRQRVRGPGAAGRRQADLIDPVPRIGHAGCRIAFIDPAATENCLIELAELPGAVR